MAKVTDGGVSGDETGLSRLPNCCISDSKSNKAFGPHLPGFGTRCATTSAMRDANRCSEAGGAFARGGAAGLAAAVVVLAFGAWASAAPTSAPAGLDKPLVTDVGARAGDLVWHMLAAMLIVLLLGCAAYFVFKKVLPRIKSSSGKRIRVAESAYLAPRLAVHLLEVGSIKLLVASSRDRVIKLGDVTDAFASDYADVAHKVSAKGEGDDRGTSSGEKETP